MPARQRSSTLTVALVVVALALAGTAVGLLVSRGNGGGGGGGTSSTGTSATPTSGTGSTSSTPPPTTDIKPAIVGLIDRNGMPPAQFRNTVRAFVVQTTWAALQPVQGGPIASDNAIDQAVAAVRALEARDPSLTMAVKLRVYAGVDAPAWAKEIGGPPITIQGQGASATFNGTIGRYWTTAYGDAYDQFEDELAAKYDDVPQIREEVMSRCTIEYAESFTRAATVAAIRSALLAAGYTVPADEACIRSEITEAAVWRHTRSDLALNPYQEVMDPHPAVDVGFTIQMMQFCRATLGERCVLESNSIRTPPQPNYVPIYDEMQTLGAPISFQTATASRVGSLAATLQYAASLGASSVELPTAYQSLSPSAVQGLAADLGTTVS